MGYTDGNGTGLRGRGECRACRGMGQVRFCLWGHEWVAVAFMAAACNAMQEWPHTVGSSWRVVP